MFVKHSAGIEIAVGRRIKFRKITFQWVSAELLDVNRHRSSQTLRAQYVAALKAADNNDLEPLKKFMRS